MANDVADRVHEAVLVPRDLEPTVPRVDRMRHADADDGRVDPVP